MKTQLLAAAAVTLSAASAHAVGLDRSGQRIGILFETGNLVELSFGFTDPHLSGNANAAFGGAPTGNVADSFAIASFGLKYDVSEELSLALIVDEPYGTDVLYGGDPAFTILGGTGATADSFAVTALARYKFNENFSVHGGLRYQEISASVTTAGFAFNGGAGPGVQAGVNGYSGRFGSDGDLGYVIGASYEIPDIALRVSLTYNSETVHDLPTVETLRGAVINPGSVTEVTAPESVNLSFQSGVAKDTLVFGSIRYARYSDTDVSPAGFTGVLTGNSLTDLEDGFDYEIGVGRRFNDKWSGSVTIGFSTVGDDNLVSPLAPTNGSRFIAVGGRYNVNDSFAVSGGIRYTALGSAFSAPGGTPVAFFDSNSAVSAGVRFTYNF